MIFLKYPSAFPITMWFLNYMCNLTWHSILICFLFVVVRAWKSAIHSFIHSAFNITHHYIYKLVMYRLHCKQSPVSENCHSIYLTDHILHWQINKSVDCVRSSLIFFYFIHLNLLCLGTKVLLNNQDHLSSLSKFRFQA